MAITGRFGNSTGRPYINGYILLPALNLRGSISFLVDTGADGTVIMPTDMVRLGIKGSMLKTETTSIGVGGTSHDFVEDAVLVVQDGAMLHGYDISIRIMRKKKALATVPSLLGRDVLNRWHLHVDHSGNRLTADIVSSDHQVPAKP